MPDTGAPHFIPFLDGTELVRAYPAFSEDLADAVADGLSAAGGLVAVKSAIRTEPFVSQTVTAGGSVAIPGLQITHSMSNAFHKLIISAYLGSANQPDNNGRVGIAVNDGTGLINVGDAAGSRVSVTAGARVSAVGAGDAGSNTMPSFTNVYEPGTTNSITYTVHAVLIGTSDEQIFVNRAVSDVDNALRQRATSGLVIQEVRV